MKLFTKKDGTLFLIMENNGKEIAYVFYDYNLTEFTVNREFTEARSLNGEYETFSLGSVFLDLSLIADENNTRTIPDFKIEDFLEENKSIDDYSISELFDVIDKKIEERE